MDDSPASASSTAPRSARSSASPSFHHRGISLGPGQLFVPRISALVVDSSSAGSVADSSRLSPRSAISGAVQLAPLRSHRVSSVQVDLSDPAASQTSAAHALPPIRLARVLPPPRVLLAPLPTLAVAAASPHRVPLVELDKVLEEHELNQIDAAHAHERERQQQLQRARRVKEERRQQKEAAAAGALERRQ